MTLLNRKLRRDLLAIRGRILAIALIIATGVGIFHGIGSALADLRMTQDNAIERLNLADIEIEMAPTPPESLPALETIEGISTVEPRLLAPTAIELEDGSTLAGLAVGRPPGGGQLNLLELSDGRDYVDGAGGIIIERALSQFHGYQVGDVLPVRIDGAEQKLSIVGIATSPEFLVTTSNPDYVIPEPGSLGVFWVDPAVLSSEIASTVNSLLIELDGTVPSPSVERSLANAFEGSPIQSITPWDESYAYLSIRMDLNAFEVYSPAIVVTLVLLSIGLGVLTIQRYATEKRREFGSLFAIGYPMKRVKVSLLVTGLLIGVLGGVLGLVIGSGVGWAFGEVYADSIKLSNVTHQFHPQLAGLSLILGIGAGILAFYLGSRRVFRTSTRSLLSTARPIPNQARGPKLRWLAISDRYAVRSLLRERGSTISAIVAIGAASAVAISYGLALTSTLETVENSFSRDQWTHAIDLAEPQPASPAPDVLTSSTVQTLEPYRRLPGEIHQGENQAVGVFVGLIDSSQLRNIAPSEGRPAAGQREVVLSADLARELDTTVGGTVSLVVGNRSQEVEVVGLTNDIFLKTVSMTLDSLQDLLGGEDAISGYYVQADTDFSADLLGNSDNIANVVDKDQLVDHFRQQIKDTLGIVYITIAFSLTVSVLFISTLIYLSVSERRGEFANLRSLGFTRRKIRRIIITGAVTQVTAGLLIAAPAAILLALLLNMRMGQAWFDVQLHNRYLDFVLPIAVGGLVAPAVAVLGARAANRLDIASILRERL